MRRLSKLGSRRGAPSIRALFVLLACVPATAAASGEHGVSYETWLILAAMLFIAKLGSELSVRLGQPPVLGEILAGMVLGNLRLLGVDAFADAATLPSIEFLAELGVVVLLFEVGLESTLVEMKRVAPLSGAVAVIGVVAPMILGYLASRLLMPHESMSHHLFVGATLCATSVGITARVLQDLHAMDRAETKVILGAAVIDDVLGLVVLAVVSAIAEKGAPSPMEVGTIIALAVGFLVGAVILGTFIMPGFFRASAKLRSPGVLAAISIGFCLLLSGASAMAGLAAIVGAFAAGLVLDEVHVQPFGKTSKHDLSELVHPIVNLLAPVFFVRTGMLVDLGGITVEALILAGALSVVAVLGKLVAGLGVPATRANRLLVGIGMIPRGEVGLIFANVGAAIRTEDGEALVTKGAFGAIVLMVMATTVITPPWLSYQIGRLRARETP